MTPLGLVDPLQPLPEPAAQGTAKLELRVEDVLASPRRLWVRGQLLGLGPPTAGASAGNRWWNRWRQAAPVLPGTFHLESKIGGHVFTADVPLRPDGRFEAMFSTGLPPAHRGWRVARNHATCVGQAAEKCSMTVLPPEDACGALVVVLPLQYTRTADGSQQLVRSDLAGWLTPLLRRFQNGPRGHHVLYYLACVPPCAGPQHHVELALAATTRGWPTGTFVLLPAEASAASATLAEGLDRLRWLFAGSLDLTVLNLEPAAATALAPVLETNEDRAPVSRLAGPTDDLGRGPTQPARSGIRPVRARSVTRHPIVFCHGMLALSTLRMQLPKESNYFMPLGDFLRERGFRVLFPQVSPTSGVVERARQLREQVRAWTDEPVNIIAHSMGGLDARHMIAHLDMAGHVRTLTTIATPHRGTYLADWFCSTYGQRVPLLTAFQTLGVNMDGFRDCGRDACRAFNAATPDVPGVRYFSYCGEVSQSRVSPVLRRAWNLLTPVEGPNDGMVSVASARWGECLGTVHADHCAQTPDAVHLRPGEDFDALGFYARLVEDLARRGF
jgi:triacylglycerol lipase